MRCLSACALPLLMIASAATAQSTLPPTASATQIVASKAFQERAKEVVALLGGKGDYDAIFAPAFREKVPKATFDAVTARLSGGGGAVTGMEQLTPDSPDSGTLLVGYARGIATMRIAVDPAEPHQVIGLLVTGMTAREASLDAVLSALAALPGTTGLALAKLDGAVPTTILAREPDRDFAIGSAFKLIILSELVREVTAGERHWNDLITLDGTPLPGGLYTARPAGTKVSIRELAEQMISISDNSATDILLKTLGREKVEAMLPVVGFHSAARDRPFLSTLDMFKLKGVAGGALGTRYLALDEKGRRALIEGEVRNTPLSAIDPKLFANGKPQSIDTIEWFASPLDLVRVMDWLRRNTETGPAAEARAILSKNSGVGPVVAGAWRYLGYKGGSEPGVMNMTFVLQGQDGSWYALTGSWNDTAAPIDESRFASLMGRAVELAAPR
ncbi:MAG: serine hydrolase [Sphingomonas sp.]